MLTHRSNSSIVRILVYYADTGSPLKVEDNYSFNIIKIGPKLNL
jgi:hypothetical protein